MEDQIFRTMDASIKVVKDSWSKDIAAIRSLFMSWLKTFQQAECYFEFYGTSENNKLLRASFYLDGEVLEWFRWLFRNKQLSDWEHFVAKVRIRFGKQHLEFLEGHVATIKDYSTGIKAQVFEKMSHGCCCSKVFATERSEVKVVTNALESDLKDATTEEVEVFDESSHSNSGTLPSHSETLQTKVTTEVLVNRIGISTNSVPMTSLVILNGYNCNVTKLLEPKNKEEENASDNAAQVFEISPLRDETGYQIALTSQGSIMSNAIGRFIGIKFPFAGATQNILGHHYDSDIHICYWVDTGHEQIFTSLLSSISRETAMEQKVQSLGSIPRLIQNREKHEIFTVRTDLTLLAHAQHPGEPHLFHGIVHFDYMGGDYKPQFQLGALFERKETRTTFLSPVSEGLPDGKHYIVSSFDMLPGLAEGRGNGMKRLNSLSNLVGKGIIFSVWDLRIGLQLLTLIISSCGILLHVQTHAVFVNAKQYKRSVGALAVHKNECILVCEGIHKRVVRCWHSQKSITLLQAFDPGGVHQETKLYLFQDSEYHNPTKLKFKGRYHAQQALPSRYLAQDIALIWHCDELLIMPSNGRGSYLYPEKREVRSYVCLEVIIEGRPYARYFIVGSLDMLTGFAERVGSGIIFLVSERNLRNSLLYFCLYDAPDVCLYVHGSCANSFGFSSSVSDVGLAIEDAHTALATKFSSDVREYVPFPKEESPIKKEIVKDITFHYLDVASDQPQGERDILSLMCQLMAPRKIKFDHFIPSIKRWRVLVSMAILSIRRLKFPERLLKLGIGEGDVHIEIRPIYLAISYASIYTDAKVTSHYNSCDSICTDAAVKSQ
ncbi:ruvb-like protein 1 [Nicotiana attenuata]|uniref:Ruvb-like protein 1 n=1 Tax=Nicotiana attenuata TaxID=49451 RepID=A0A314LD56_NICAT|nr:ruvb-like protein 1 [Nicotiana attenuata]